MHTSANGQTPTIIVLVFNPTDLSDGGNTGDSTVTLNIHCMVCNRGQNIRSMNKADFTIVKPRNSKLTYNLVNRLCLYPVFLIILTISHHPIINIQIISVNFVQ